jgi:hypothetical protein
MQLWFPSQISKVVVIDYIKRFDRNTFKQRIQDKINSRFPSFDYVKVYVDEEFNEIDTLCTICYEDGEFQLNCGHIFHKYCINRWKQKSDSCPLCRQKIKY